MDLKKILFPLIISSSILFNSGKIQKSYLPFLEEKEKFVPNYEKNLTEAFMKDVPNFLTQSEFYFSLPDYSNIYLLTSNEYLSNSNLFNFKDLDFFYYKSSVDLDWRWSQDLFETLESSSEKIIYLPNLYRKKDVNRLEKMFESNGYITKKSKNYFEGGNLCYDYFNSENILFVGLRNSLSSLEVEENYKSELGIDKVIFLGHGQEKTPIFHIDQFFLLVDSGEVALMNLDLISLNDVKNYVSQDNEFLKYEGRYVLGTKEEKLLKTLELSKDILDDAKEKFLGLGYKVNEFPVTLNQFFNYQSPFNSVVYFNLEEKRKEIILPLFLEHSQNQKSIEFFENLGLHVIPVYNDTWAQQGNFNCLLNYF